MAIACLATHPATADPGDVCLEGIGEADRLVAPCRAVAKCARTPDQSRAAENVGGGFLNRLGEAPEARIVGRCFELAGECGDGDVLLRQS